MSNPTDHLFPYTTFVRSSHSGLASTSALLSRYSTPPQALAGTTMASRTGRRMRVILSFGVGRDCAAAAPKRHAPERSAVAGAASAASSSGPHRDQEERKSGV